MDTSVLIAITSAVSAILSALLTSLITQRGSRKTKAKELFFNARAEAYRDLIKSTTNFPLTPTTEDAMSFDNASASAILFSSKDTQERIANYCAHVLASDYSEEGLNGLAEARRDAILAMQKDLQKYKI